MGFMLTHTVSEATPVAERLVGLLAPWDRARVRLTCRALAAAVPARSCAGSLSAMVRAGGAELLRYGAGDARPCWTHVLIAVEADAADALRWMLRCDDDDRSGDVDRGRAPHRWRSVALDVPRVALRMGSVAVWRLLGPSPSPSRAEAPPCYPFMLLCDAIQGGAESLVVECAAAAAGAASAHIDPSLWRFMVHCATVTNMSAAIEPFLRPSDDRPPWLSDAAARAALRMGRRDLLAPHDWRAMLGITFLKDAVHGGQLDLAEAALRDGVFNACTDRALLRQAMEARCNSPAVIEWAVATCRLSALTLPRDTRHWARVAIDHDGAAALRWLVERAAYAPDDAMLDYACRADAVACVRYLHRELAMRPTQSAFTAALAEGAHHAASVVAPCVAPLDAQAFVALIRGPDAAVVAGHVVFTSTTRHALRAMAMLRRHRLLPTPDAGFLRLCATELHKAHELRMLAVAGYPVDTPELRGWLDFVRPRCAPGSCHEQDAADLHARWHRLCANETPWSLVK